MSTPIRVRGKNRRDQSVRSLCKPTLGTKAAASSRRKPGRPLKILTLRTNGGSITSDSPANSPSSSRLNSPSTSSIDSSNRTKTASKRRRRRSRTPRLSLLELLPLELIQTIFILSDNLALPLASPFLARSLSSYHVYTALCTRAFLIDASELEKDPDLQSAILRQPWFTMEFVEMIERELGDRNLPARALSSARLPARLVRAPWTHEKVELLRRLLNHDVRVDWINTTAGEEAEQGLRDAILEGCLEAVKLLTSEHVGVVSSTELLKVAVFLGGCREGIVRHLIYVDLLGQVRGKPSRVDLTDAEIWHFALQQGRPEEDRGPSNGDFGYVWMWLARLLQRALRSLDDDNMLRELAEEEEKEEEEGYSD